MCTPVIPDGSGTNQCSVRGVTVSVPVPKKYTVPPVIYQPQKPSEIMLRPTSLWTTHEKERMLILHAEKDILTHKPLFILAGTMNNPEVPTLVHDMHTEFTFKVGELHFKVGDMMDVQRRKFGAFCSGGFLTYDDSCEFVFTPRVGHRAKHIAVRRGSEVLDTIFFTPRLEHKYRMAVCECVIPTGARLCVNEKGEYMSDRIIITENFRTY